MRRIKSFDLLSGYNYYVPGVKGMFALLGMFLVGALLGNVVTYIISLISSSFAKTYGILFSYPVMFIPPMFYASFKSRGNALFETGYALDNKNFGAFSGFSIALAASVATFALSIVAGCVTKLLPPMPERLEAMLSNLVDGPIWAALLSVSVFAPFFEEWLCRGMILRGLMQKMHPLWAMVISSLVFAVIHLNPWQAIPAFAIGMLFGYVYWRTGSLKLTMLMHCVNNTIAVIASHLGNSKDVESISDVLSPLGFTILIIICTLMAVFFVLRVQMAVPLPLGRNNACKEVNDAEDIA